MPRWPLVVVTVLAFVIGGFVVPIGALMWLLIHHEPPFVLDSAAMATPRTALGGRPVAVRPATGIFDIIADGGTTAVYADGGTATIVRTTRPSQVIEKYGSSLDERGSSSSSIGGFTQRDARLGDGRLARTFGFPGTVIAFVAPSAPSLARLVAQSAIRRNPKRDIGNTVLDDHATAAIFVAAGWLLLTALLALVVIVRVLKTTLGRPVPWYERPQP
ncbi:MAG TPA: hypothetical protein VGD01_17000 [Candidatus Elarobacter sp.]|jgi:hypothetical protein